ncbi:MAG: DUF3592 domain-containing protein [Spirochaetaceae bacterium]|nr:MAG: DUF3592 domain-containing protein [Spirochaetaceae bacterium]
MNPRGIPGCCINKTKEDVLDFRTLFSRAFLTIAAILGVAGGINSLTTAVFLRHAVTAVGVVSGFERETGRSAPFLGGGETGVIYYPTVEFRTADGNRRSFTSPVGRSRREPAVGAMVGVRYHPRHTGSERIDAPFEIWGRAAIFGGLAVLFALIGVIGPLGLGKPEPGPRPPDDEGLPDGE